MSFYGRETNEEWHQKNDTALLRVDRFRETDALIHTERENSSIKESSALC